MQVQKRYAYYFFITALLFVCAIANAQKATDAISQSFYDHRSDQLQEKLFVHTDKAFYMAGEIIWFKIYATDAQLNRPLDLSKLSYVELLNKENKPVLQAKIAMTDGSGNGSFQLPYSVNSGNYTLRAYTNWMKNGGADFFFEKNITIVNALRKPEWPVADSVNYDVQFFPEGGNLVAGIQSKIAFRVIDSHGRSIDCKGAVLDQKNDTVARFTTLRFGMGHFEWKPQSGEQYRSVITTNENIIITKTLPVAYTKGIVMRVSELDKNKLRVTIQSNTGATTVSLLAHTRDLLKLVVSREMLNGRAEIEIDKKQLGEGISHFTLFNELKQPVCERLYFKKPEALSVNMKPDAQNYGTRRKVTIDLSTNDVEAHPVTGNLSMSVYLLDSLQAPESTDINSYLWLQSDLKGNIESPGYYFSNSGTEVEEATDNLLLTQGWRRFRWENNRQKQNKEAEFLPETEGHIINGRLIDKRNGQPAENITAYLSVPAEKPLFNTDISTKDGLVRFNVQNFYGGNEIVVQTNSLTDSMYRIDIASPFSEKYSDKLQPVFQLAEKNAGLLVSHSMQAQVSNTYYADKQQNFLFPVSIDTMPFYGNPDHRFYLDDYTRFITMEEVMREYVADVRVRKNNNKFNFTITNSAFNNFFETNPLVLIDGVPVFDVDKMIAFDPLKIKRADVVTQKFYQGKLVHDGIISYSTYQGDLAGYQLDANALIVEYPGLQLQREFYSPVYETAAETSSRLPDFRNLLYWSPDVHTDRNGKKQLSFYTADIPGTYIVVVQGITADGLAGSKIVTFTVTK